jgi:hypothetical protein
LKLSLLIHDKITRVGNTDRPHDTFIWTLTPSIMFSIKSSGIFTTLMLVWCSTINFYRIGKLFLVVLLFFGWLLLVVHLLQPACSATPPPP